MTLALFDLDNTLLSGDSDHSWGLFLAAIGVLDVKEQEEMQAKYYQDYLDGDLDIQEFLEFQLAPLGQHPPEQLYKWRTEFIEDIIKPMLINGKTELLEPHRSNGDTLIIITATNDFITRPIATLLGVETLIATLAECVNGKYTGKPTGVPSFKEGKVERLMEWLTNENENLSGSYFYSDSINDLPLLDIVDTAIAVTPDEKLRTHAESHNWRIID
jgi:HAD superfamily hydrolase (TIGR01490 family)